MAENDLSCNDQELQNELKKKAAAGILEEFQKKLGLENWSFEVTFTVFRANHGSINFDVYGKTASLQINSNDSLAEIKRTIFHELFHILLENYTRPIHNFYQHQFKRIFEAADDEFCCRMEGLFDEE